MKTPGIGDDITQFFRPAGIGEAQYDIILCDHAEVAMARFCRVNELGGRACGGKRRGYLVADMSAFPHAADDNATPCLEDKIEGFHKLAVEIVQKLQNRIRLYSQDFSGRNKIGRLVNSSRCRVL